MIKFITADDVLPIRNQVLREGKLTLDECRFPNDDADEAFHLGYYKDEELACIASFHPKGYEGYEGKAYQLRGMATTEQYRGKGYGNMLVNFAITYLRGQGVNYVWCNARKKAVPFYLGVGFEIISPEFEVPGIGPHHVMYVKIR
ncbi:GNAT family N-acetyltransferase [Mucilaginibacter terrigena]|uniref:GNAT family N-acetyltransferase n=1 Tax=Mucilaginibacter terrigena TaxID=2492395 RepID=A0A4Q5LKM2_9SPHI|nr:GNAT family N-acetyltransferase [Mucilaginibacter terrigena]RYU90156.1 GNAT family N-acetyltransferase [Mucilaginibacter terrigena]